MKNNGFKFGHRNILGVFLALLALLMGACSEKDSVEDYVPTETKASVKFSIKLECPEMESTLIGYPAEGVDGNTDFYSHFNEGASRHVFVKQNGKMIELGDFKVEISESDNSVGVVSVDAKDVVTAGQPYDVYLVGGAYRYDNNGVYFRRNLTRKSGFYSWYKFSSSTIPTKADGKIDGTVEMLFVINKSGAPIKFKHKGFDVANRWYHTYGEVSIDNGTVTEYEDGKEVEGEVREVPVFTGENATIISSYYVPSGNKISEAQLIAEIDGKEVRSENRISSDLTIQLYHSYAMFAVWDGEKLRMGDGNGEVEVIDLSDPVQSGIDVISISDNGTMTIETTEDKVPKVGDMLCSGPSEMAPYGYLFKVTGVTSTNGQSQTRGDSEDRTKFILKVITIGLCSAIDNFHATFRFPISLNDVKVSNVMTEEGINLTSSGDYQTVWQLPKKKFTFGDVSFTPNVKIKPESLALYLEVGNKRIQKFGADFDAEFEASVQIDANFKGTAVDKTYRIYDVFLEPITVMVGPVPVVITPYFMVYLTIKVDGSAQLSWIPVSCEYDVHLGGYFDTELVKFVPSKGKEKILTYENCKQTQDTWLDLNSGFTVKGSVKSGVGVGLSLGLYGCNLVGKGNVPIKTNGYMINLDNLSDLASLEVYSDLYDKMTAGISLDDIELKPGEEYHFDDICKTSIEFACGVSLHLGFNNPITGNRIGFDPSYETDPFVLLKEKDGQTLFWPGFVRTKASLNGDNLQLTSDKLRPLFSIFEEKGFGYRYVKIKDGQISGDWAMVDVSNNYTHDVYKTLWEYTVEADIPINKFEWGNTYFICPYTCFRWYDNGDQYYISRQGFYITINNDGNLTFNELGEVPGEDL